VFIADLFTVHSVVDLWGKTEVKVFLCVQLCCYKLYSWLHFKGAMLFIVMVTVISPTVPVLNTFNKH